MEIKSIPGVEKTFKINAKVAHLSFFILDRDVTFLKHEGVKETAYV